MEALPKIVRQRLQLTAKPGVHPGADLLTAFAEKALTERERTRVVEHLSRCEDCREVMFLAAAQEAPAPATGRVSHREGWLGWSALRWGAALACVVIVGTAVTLFREGQNHSDVGGTVASEKAAAPAPSRLPAGAGNVASEGNRGSPAASRDDVAPASGARPSVTPPNPAPPNLAPRNKDADARESVATAEPPVRPGRKAMTATPTVRMQFDQSREINENGVETDRPATVANGAAAAAPAVLAKGGNMAAQSANGQMQTKAAVSRYTAAPASAEAGPSGQGASDFASTAVKTNNPSVSGGPVVASPAVDATAEKRLRKKELDRASAKLEIRWMLTPAGALQRSEDAGNTWELAAVTGEGPFQSIAAAGSEVWLGGGDGVLYHSSDAGLHWARVIVQANGAGPDGAITRIEFRDVQKGRVTTATGEIWTTLDAGKTWQKN